MGNNDSKLDWSLDSKDNPSGDDKDISKWKVMLQALCTDNIEQVESALKDWNMTATEAHNLIVQSKDEYGYNTLHLVAMSASRETIVQLLDFITDDEAKQELILNSDNITRSNVLHLVARTNSIRRSVSRCLTEENQTRGLKALDYKERTPIQIALTSRPQAALSMICKLPDEDFHQYVTEALNKNLDEGFSRALKKSDDRLLLACIQHDDVGVIKQLKASDYPLSSSQINILSPMFHDFIVPKKQSITKKQGLVCYCAAEREGAKEEAETLKAALKDVGFSVQVYEWKLFSEMRTWLTQSVNIIALETSVLFLAVMSHGFSGNVSGEDGSYGELSDVLDITRSGIPAHIPIIGFVQACQAENKISHDYISEPSTSGQQQERLEEQQLKQLQEQQLGQEQEQQQHQQMITEPVGGYAPHGQTGNGDLYTDSTPQVPDYEDAAMVPKSDSQHVILRSQEVAIMIATVHGGKAYRGRFTQAFSRVLRETSGRRNICELFQRAARLLNKEPDRKQIPEFRSTLTKTLSL